MQIGSLFGSYDQNLNNSVKVEGNAEAVKSAANVDNTNVDLTNLKEGSVFKGEILNVTNDKVLLDLGEGAQIAARLQADFDLGIGDQLLFSVKENNANQIMIKPMFDSLYSAQTQVLEKALDHAGLSPTEKNFSAVKSLMDNGQSLDRGSIVKLLSQSMKNPEASMDTLTSLNKMNIPVTKENIAQFERYQDYNHQLINDINQSVSEMSSFVKAFPGDVKGEVLLEFASDMVELFQENSMESGVEGSALTSELDSQETQTLVDGKEVSQELSETVSNANNIENGKVTDSPMAVVNSENNAIADTNHQLNPQTVANNELETVNGDGKELPVKELSDESIAKEIGQQFDLSKSESKEIVSQLKSMGMDQQLIQDTISQSKDSTQFLKAAMNFMNHNHIDDATIREFLSSDGFKKMFSDMIHKSWSITPSDMKNPKELDEMYDRIVKQSKGFEDKLASMGGDAKGFQESSQNMKQNMSFMEQINQQMVYGQIPIKLSNQNANSELFVYANKRKLAEKTDGISVMLHLDMDNLGQTDVKVTLTGNKVHARFYLNDQESVDIVCDHMNELEGQLRDRGFQLSNEVVKRQPAESINKVVDEIIDADAERSIKRYTFDAKM